MKKFLAIFFTSFLITTSSHATGFFVGADALYGSAKHRATNSSTTSGPNNGEKNRDEKFNYGVNAGYRLDVLNLLASAELFYDNLNVSSHSFKSPSNSGDKINIENRYGAKLNAGFAIFPRVTPFVTFGLANIRYSSLATNGSIAKTNLRPLYGIGLLIDLPLGFSVKAAYDYQQFGSDSNQAGARIKSHLGVARIGVVYNF